MTMMRDAISSVIAKICQIGRDQICNTHAVMIQLHHAISRVRFSLLTDYAKMICMKFVWVIAKVDSFTR